MANIIHKIREVKPVFWFLLLAALVLLSAVLAVLVNDNRLPNNSTGGGDNTSSQSTKSRVQEFSEKYDIVYSDGGEIYFGDYALANKLKITDTNSTVISFEVSPDRKTIVYTTTDRDFVSAQVQKLLAKYPDPDINKNITIATKLFTYDVETGVTKQLLDYSNFDLLADYASLPTVKQYGKAIAYNNRIIDHGITLHSFSTRNPNEIVFSGKGVWILNVVTGEKVKVSDSLREDIATLGVGSTLYTNDFMLINFFSWDNSIGNFFAKEGNTWKQVQIKSPVCDNIEVSMINTCELIEINSRGEYVFNTSVYKGVNGYSVQDQSKVSFVDPTSGKVLREVDFLANKVIGDKRLLAINSADESMYFQVASTDARQIYKLSTSGELTMISKVNLPKTDEFKYAILKSMSIDAKYGVVTTSTIQGGNENKWNVSTYTYELATGNLQKVGTYTSAPYGDTNYGILVKFY